jgi:hypothetical protein
MFHKNGTGALLDTRPGEKKIKDYKFEETVAAAAIEPVIWTEKKQSEWRKFPIFNQDGSGSCVAQTAAKLLGIMYWLLNGVYVHFSATHIYKRRSNAPGSGMLGVDALDIMTEGVTLEELTPSQNMTDAQMDATEIPEYKERVGEIFKIATNYLQPEIKDIDKIASIIQKTGKGVMVWFYFTRKEWTDRPFIDNANLDLNAPSTLRHSVTAVDFTLVDGKKCLIIEDSWGPNYGLNGQRIIDEDFFKARNFFAAYPINFKFRETEATKPYHFFATDLEQNMQGPEVVALQDCLKYTCDFPTNIGSTGYYGSITADAVGKFQERNGITKKGMAGYGRTGPKTREQLNEIFKPQTNE